MKNLSASDKLALCSTALMLLAVVVATWDTGSLFGALLVNGTALGFIAGRDRA